MSRTRKYVEAKEIEREMQETRKAEDFVGKVEEISILRRLLKKKNRDEETVADDLDLSLEYVHKINELLSAYPMESDEEIVKRIAD